MWYFVMVTLENDQTVMDDTELSIQDKLPVNTFEPFSSERERIFLRSSQGWNQ